MLSIHPTRTLVHLVAALLLILATVVSLRGSDAFSSPQADPARSELLAADDFTNNIKLPIIGEPKI